MGVRYTMTCIFRVSLDIPGANVQLKNIYSECWWPLNWAHVNYMCCEAYTANVEPDKVMAELKPNFRWKQKRLELDL